MSAELAPLHQRPPATPWRRVAARAIDAATVVTLLWTLVVTHALWFMPELTDRFQPEPWGRSFVATLAFLVLAAIYEAVFVVRNEGQTPGKDLMDLRVVGPRTDGRMTVARTLARWSPLAVVPVVRPAWAAVLGVAVMAATVVLGSRWRPVTDAIAGTVVVGYDRDLEDPTARQPSTRRRRRAEARRRAEVRTGIESEPRRPTRGIRDVAR